MTIVAQSIVLPITRNSGDKHRRDAHSTHNEIVPSVNRENPDPNPAPPAYAPLGENEQPTLQGIADRSGFSVTTVSRVLSGQAGRYRISKQTEATVRKLAKEFNFVPNDLARSLRLKRTSDHSSFFLMIFSGQMRPP